MLDGVGTNARRQNGIWFLMDLYHKSMRMFNITSQKYKSPIQGIYLNLHINWKRTSNQNSIYPKNFWKTVATISTKKQKGDLNGYRPCTTTLKSLREPKTWLDNQSELSIWHRQLITFPRNRGFGTPWVKQPEVLYKGKTKRICLSFRKNGNQLTSYSQQDFKGAQAAG